MRVLDAELAGYVRCPLAFYFKDIDRQSAVIKRVVRYLFYSFMDGRIASWRNFANKFLSLWQEEGFDIEAGRKRLKAGEQGMLERLYTFYKQETERKQAILAVGLPYEVNIEEHTVAGEIDVVRKTSEGIEVVDFRLSSAREWTVRYDIAVACKSYAFRSMYGVRETAVVVYCLPALPAKSVVVGHLDYLKVAEMLSLVEKAVAAGIYYPRPSSYCSWCSVKNKCRQWPVPVRGD